jgi:HEAT repeat protein
MMPNADPYFLHTLHACHHSDRNIRLRALEMLEKEYIAQVKADFLLHLLERASDYEEQAAILSVMSLLGPRAPVEELTTRLLDRDTQNWMLREAVARALAALGEPAPLDIFISILQNPTEEVGLREEIAYLLGRFGERVPVEVLVAAIGESDPAICAAAIESVMAQGHRAPLEPILAHITHPEWYVRMAAVRALSAAHERAPIEPVVAALGDPDARVREAAVMGIDLLIEWFGARVPLKPLITALSDEDANVRESALDVLANHPEFAPIELVIAALNDQNPYVRCAALLVLERMGSPRVPEEVYPILLTMASLDPYPNARKYANKAILTLKGFSPGTAHDFPGEEFTGS